MPGKTNSDALDGAIRDFDQARADALAAMENLSSCVATIAHVTSTVPPLNTSAVIAHAIDGFVAYLATKLDVSNHDSLTALAKAFLFDGESSPRVDEFIASGQEIVLHPRHRTAYGTDDVPRVLPAKPEEALENLSDSQIKFLLKKVQQVKRARLAQPDVDTASSNNGRRRKTSAIAT